MSKAAIITIFQSDWLRGRENSDRVLTENQWNHKFSVMNVSLMSQHTSNILLKYRGGPLIIGAVHLLNLLTHHNSSALAVLNTAASSPHKQDTLEAGNTTICQ